MIDFDTRAKIGSFLPGGTPGSILFVDAAGKLAQDNDKIFWDEVNLRLGVKVPVPEEAIHVDGRIRITNGNGFQWGDGSTRIIGNSTAGFTAFFNNNIETFRNISTNRTGFGLILPAAKVHIVPNSTTEIGQIIQGVVSQSADLFQTKDSAGTILGVIAANGYRGLGTNSPNEQLELTENFRFPHTTYNGGNQYGVMYKAGTRFIHNFNYGDNGTVTTLGENLFIGENSGNFQMGSTATQVFQASFNTGVGTATLFANTLGNSNMAIGYYVLTGNTTGSNNFGGGANSLSSNTTGSGNAATGQSSLRGNVGGYWNTASGNDAGRYISGGGPNTNSNTSVFLGYDTRPLADSQGNQIVIGYAARGMGSNTATLGNTSIADTYLRGGVHIEDFLLSKVGLTIQGAVSQSGNLTEWKNNNGTVVAAIDPNGFWGVGISPLYKVHIYRGASGATPPVGIDTVVVEDDDNAAITIICPDNKSSRFAHGSPSDGYAARTEWRFDSLLYILGTANTNGEVSIESANKVEAIRIDSNQLVRTTSDLYIGVDGAGEREFRVYSDRAGDYLSIENYGNYGGFYSHGVDNWLMANTTPSGYMTFWTHNGSSFGERTRMDTNGYWGYFTDNPGAVNHIATDATTTIGEITQAIVAQSADLKRYLKSDDTIYSGTNNIGERFSNDSVKNWFGTGLDMSVYYDGTDGHIKTNEVAASDLKVDCGTNKTIELQETVYNDLVLPLDSARVPAANAPSWESLVGNLNAYAYEVNDYQEFTAELLHGYKTGSDLEFHVHGALNAALAGGDETVKFEIEYSIANMDGTDGLGDAFPSTTTINKEFIVPNGTADLTSIYISIGTDSTGSFGMGATIKGRIRRIASSGTELVGDMFVTQIGVHYEIDTIGSRQITTK